MKQRFSFILVLVLVVVGGGFGVPPDERASADAQAQAIAGQIIAREKAAFDAWQRRDKAFYAGYWADDFTEFLPHSPHLIADPKTNLLPKFEQITERWKILDFQMHDPRVQAYGHVAVLTYTESIEGKYDGQPVSYTGKVTMVYVKQGGTWRGVHYHESANPASR
jgi:ketosteroid isomerase-like protein